MSHRWKYIWNHRWPNKLWGKYVWVVITVPADALAPLGSTTVLGHLQAQWWPYICPIDYWTGPCKNMKDMGLKFGLLWGQLYIGFLWNCRFKIWGLNMTLIARFMGPTWGPSGDDRTQVGLMLAPWTLLSGILNAWAATLSVLYSMMWSHTYRNWPLLA